MCQSNFAAVRCRRANDPWARTCHAGLAWLTPGNVMRVLTVVLGLAVVVTLLPEPLYAQRGKVVCDGDAPLKVTKIRKRNKNLARSARRAGVHVLDLDDESQEQAFALRRAVRAKKWCDVVAQLEALESAFRTTNVDADFLRKKAARVQGWVQGTLNGGRKSKQAEQLVTSAKSEIDQGKLKAANAKLNKVLATLTGSKDPLVPPRQTLVSGVRATPNRDYESESDSADVNVSTLLSRSLALESCPELQAGEPSNGELASILERLRSAMSENKYRAVDFKYGGQLFEILVEEGRDGSRGRAATAACVLLTRISETQIGLGVAMGRFNRVNALQKERGVPDAANARFTLLVRQATDEIAQKSFAAAFETLDELLVLLGDPVDQSQDVP